ncbi:hypothetical protein Pfo_004683 [Paulownia fortunei]|nr:hypothetical protein Pfo_004683 [Paulownia fortunei]
MDSSSGISSISTELQNSGSEEDLMDQRKRKRMISERESARRTRLRKQKQLDDLKAEVTHLREENRQILTGFKVTTQNFFNVKAENAILRARVDNLSHKLQAIVSFLSAGLGGAGV